VSAFNHYGNKNAFIALINEESYQVLSDIWIIVDYVREELKTDIETLTLDQIAKEGKLQSDGTLTFRGWEIAVAYFRTGYIP